MMDKIELNGQFWKVNNVALVFYERLLDWKNCHATEGMRDDILHEIYSGTK